MSSTSFDFLSGIHLPLNIYAKDISTTAASSPFLTIIVLILVYNVVKTVYRLALHPLARFPGPKLAAITSWHEFYYQVIQGGRFYLEIQKMHQQYGPIVRVTPSELHIDDPEFYDTLFNFSSKFDKKQYQLENLQHTPSFELHKLRRQAMGPFFSRQSVLKLEYLIKEEVEKVCAHLEAAKASKQLMDMSIIYRSLTSDVISEYAFSQSYGFLDDLERSKTFFDTFSNLGDWLPVLSQVLRSLHKLPEWMQWFIPQTEETKPMVDWHKVVRSQAQNIMSGSYDNDKEHPTIFGEIQRGKLPARDKTEESIFTNAVLLMTAGFETTGFTLSVAHYHLLSNPSILHSLKSELSTAFSSSNIPPWTTLEKLPYLYTVVQESLRLSVGVMSRLQRKNMVEDMQYGEWTIKRGTLVGMSQPMIHFNERIFPEPWKFMPERWLGDENRGLEKYLVSFSRGARECVAKQLAKAELYLTLATVFHRFDMELFETTRADVDPRRDYFVAGLEAESKGVRVLVK